MDERKDERLARSSTPGSSGLPGTSSLDVRARSRGRRDLRRHGPERATTSGAAALEERRRRAAEPVGVTGSVSVSLATAAARLLGLELQQQPLSLQPAAVADERAVGPDHSVAGTITAIGLRPFDGADGAERVRPTHGAGRARRS